MPWHPGFAQEVTLDAIPLAAARELGTRDRLSLLGQYAAHEAFLQFAGVAESEFRAEEWVIVQKRAVDCRLVRIGARAAADDAPPVLSNIQRFASVVAATNVDVLQRSWSRAETVYHDIEARLRADASADLRWLHASALGSVLSPGAEALRTLTTQTNGRYRVDDVSAFRAIDGVLFLGDHASPLERYAAIRALETIVGNLDQRGESEIVERVVAEAAQSRRVFALVREASFDAASRRIIELLLAAGAGVWIRSGEGQELPETMWFLLSPRLPARRELDLRLSALRPDARGRWLEALVQSPALHRYLDDAVLPPIEASSPAINAIGEPLRSYVAAVALLGDAPVEMVDLFLERLVSNARAADVAIGGVAAIRDGDLRFASEDMRQQAMETIPAASRSSLRRLAAEVAEWRGDWRRAALLLLEAGDAPAAAERFVSVTWSSAEDMVRTLRNVPREVLPLSLARTLGGALVQCGRYSDARDLIAALPAEDAQPLLAIIEQRTGGTEPTLARLSQLDEGDNPYRAARAAAYRSVKARDLEAAISNAREAVSRAGNVVDRIDATLDLLYALFCAGRWDAARAAALDALLLVDETQGDRAACGILLLLAFLAADDGQWAHAAHLLERLRQFHSNPQELEMLAAQIDFSRGRFAAAARAASGIVSASASGQIREAAALLLDEIEWIKGRPGPLRSTGSTANVGLCDRHALMCARRGQAFGGLHSDFARRLLQWEESGGTPPRTSSRSEKLMLFRAALGRKRVEVAEAIAAEMHVPIETEEKPADVELRVLRAAALAAYPFAARDFDSVTWRYATRNRLGQWHEIGSLPPLAGAELDRALAAPADDWIACSDRELLYVDGIERWAAESREAVAALFRIRAEHHRLVRLQQEHAASAPGEPVDGIVGDSQPMREVYALIGRLARRDVTVCILGESGTGKELVARAIHRQSARKHKPFTAINCAALPENLIESELFGHARGAFTGADRDRAGLIETTDGGTLFLDEIGEMPLAAQAKLLRFLQEGEFRRVGETVNRSADVRVLAATNRKLEAAVEQGRFREDLYYRVRGVEVALPPLRDRAGDVPLLASHFLAVERQKHRCGPTRLSSEAEAAFASYHWPGNVRELQNAIRAAHALAGEAKEIDLEHLPERLRRIKIVRTPPGSYQDAVARFRRELIEKSLAHANGNQNRAAAMLKISRQALAYQIRELGILVTPPKPPRV